MEWKERNVWAFHMKTSTNLLCISVMLQIAMIVLEGLCGCCSQRRTNLHERIDEGA